VSEQPPDQPQQQDPLAEPRWQQDPLAEPRWQQPGQPQQREPYPLPQWQPDRPQRQEPVPPQWQPPGREQPSAWEYQGPGGSRSGDRHDRRNLMLAAAGGFLLLAALGVGAAFLIVSGKQPAKGATAAATASPSLSTPAPASSLTPSAAASGRPMTGDELVWLEAINELHTDGNWFLGLPCCVTTAQMRAIEEEMRGCTRELARLGLPTERLQPVYKLAQKGCAEYDKAAECMATAAKIGAPPAGTSAERKSGEALDCAFSAPTEGASLLADAVDRGFEIKAAAG
jgi:hypothetical protein